jgi:uncharacterized OB-fold protein
MNKKCNCCGKEFIPLQPWYLLCIDCLKEEQELTEFWADCYHDDWGDRD